MPDRTGSRYPRIVVLQHHRRVPLGALEPTLQRYAWLSYVQGYQDPEEASRRISDLRRTGAYDGVLALGGPMGVYERDLYPYLDESISLLADGIRSGRPVLGLCLGAQLVAEALGGRAFLGMEIGRSREMGFICFRPTGEGRSDPLLRPFAGEEGEDFGPTLFWHQDTVSLPPGAAVLASTDLYSVAAFRWERYVYGLQFHPETTAEHLRVWTAETTIVLEEHGLSARELIQEAERRDEAIRHTADGLARAFLDLFSEDGG